MKTLLLSILLFPVLSFSQANDLAIDSVFHRTGVGGYFEHGLTYYKHSTYHLSPVEFSALITNVGVNDLTNCHLTTEVWKDGALIETFTSDSIDILSGQTDSLVIGSSYEFENAEYDYEFLYYVSSDSVDEVSSNDSISIAIEVTNYYMSRSDGVQYETVSPSDSLPLMGGAGVGILFECQEDICIGAVLGNLLEDTIGLFYEGVVIVYKLDTTTSLFELVLESEEFTCDSEELDYIIPFYEGAEFAAGEIVLIVLYSYFETPELSLSQMAEENSAFFVNDFGEPTPNFYRVPNFEVVIEYPHGICFGSVPEIAITSFYLSQSYPNPSTGSTSIPFELSQNADVMLEIENQLGQKVYTIEKENLMQGKNRIEVNTSGWAPGIYYYSLIVDGEVQTKSMVVE
ncbi:MAG: T9SS type A sorting domain-containing protein [Crocinitomicaceae bacterium]|nr:T9SS type A sorting domain-containing protein [Crocinitomicaceae bacterium]